MKARALPSIAATRSAGYLEEWLRHERDPKLDAVKLAATARFRLHRYEAAAHRPCLGFGQDHRHPRRALRALDIVQPFEPPPEDLFVEEHDSAKRLISDRSRYVSLDRKVGQKAFDLGFAHGVRMALPTEQDEPDYRDVMLLGGTG